MPPREFSSAADLLAHYGRVRKRLSAGKPPPPPPRPKPIRLLSAEATIIRDVAEYYGVSTKDIIGNRRAKGPVLARQMAMYVAHQLTKHSYPQIARHFRRDPTTVIYAVLKIQEQIKLDQELADDMAAIRKSVLPQLEGPR